MPRPMPPHTLMVGSHLMAGAILALLHLAVAPFQTPGGRVRLFSSAASFFLFLQCFLGPARPRSSSSLVRYGSWVAYHGPFYLATYAASNFYFLSSHEELDILAWGIVLFQALDPMPPMLAYYGGDYGYMWNKMKNVKSLGFMATVFHAVYVTKACTVMSFVLLLAYVLYWTSVSRVIFPLHLSWFNNDHALAAVSDEQDSAKLNSDHAPVPVVISGAEQSAKLNAASVSDEEYLVVSCKLFLGMMKSLDREWFGRRGWLSYEGDAAAMAKFRTHIHIAFQVVEEMIGQYSLLLDYNRGYRWKAVVAQAVALAESTWSPAMFETHHPREEQAVSLPQDLKLKLGHSLGNAQDQRTDMTSGSRALVYHKVPRHVWISTLQKENHADTILIWHIATCYLDMDPDYGHRYWLPESTSQANPSYDIATKLSKYCVYLVAFLPELLPGEAQATSEAFQLVVQGTRTVLGDAVDKYSKMKTLSHVGQHSSLPTFEAGVALAKRLQGIFPVKEIEAQKNSERIEAQKNSERIEALWNVLADFWVETILYIAPCNNTAKHIDMLAQGGELITHVCALLTVVGQTVRAPVSEQDGL